jgi:hypothetical protein
MEEFKYLGTTLTDQNSIQEEIKSRLKLGNACYYSVQNLLSSRLQSKNLKIKIWGRQEGCTGCWWGSLRERGHWGDQEVDGRIILKWIFRTLEGVVGNGWSWLKIGTGGGHLWLRSGTCG